MSMYIYIYIYVYIYICIYIFTIWNALMGAEKLSLERTFRSESTGLAHGLGRSSGGGDDILRGAAAAAPVLRSGADGSDRCGDL